MRIACVFAAVLAPCRACIKQVRYPDGVRTHRKSLKTNQEAIGPMRASRDARGESCGMKGGDGRKGLSAATGVDVDKC